MLTKSRHSKWPMGPPEILRHIKCSHHGHSTVHIRYPILKVTLLAHVNSARASIRTVLIVSIYLNMFLRSFLLILMTCTTSHDVIQNDHQVRWIILHVVAKTVYLLFLGIVPITCRYVGSDYTTYCYSMHFYSTSIYTRVIMAYWMFLLLMPAGLYFLILLWIMFMHFGVTYK